MQPSELQIENRIMASVERLYGEHVTCVRVTFGSAWPPGKGVMVLGCATVFMSGSDTDLHLAHVIALEALHGASVDHASVCVVRP